MNKILVLIMIAIVVAGCGSKTPSMFPADYDDVLYNVRKNHPQYCAYDGKAAIRYKDSSTNQGISTFTKKTCNGDTDIHLLGPFGINMAQIYIRDNNYQIKRGDEDVTEAYQSMIPREGVELLNRYMKLPAVTLDKTYKMDAVNNEYVFFKTDKIVHVSEDFLITKIIKPFFTVIYTWNDRELKGVTLQTTSTETKITFSGQWRGMIND